VREAGLGGVFNIRIGLVPGRGRRDHLGTIIKLSGETFRTSMPGAHLWRGMIGVISLWLWYYSIGQLPLATAMTLNYMSPIWIAVWLFAMGWWHARNDVKWPLLLAVGMSFVGVTLLLRLPSTPTS
jgi:S-adenosylmethionine uptake transporter